MLDADVTRVLVLLFAGNSLRWLITSLFVLIVCAILLDEC